MRVVFFGTPDVASVALRALLLSRHEILGCVTQPDRPKGRSGQPVSSSVKQVAIAAGLPVLQPESPKQDGFADELRGLGPDVCAVVAYGHLLPPAVLAVPPKGTVNAHFSLLPRYRGAAPVQRAIMAGDSETGVSVFVLEPTLDTGPLLQRVSVPIDADDTTGSLLERLGEIGAGVLIDALDGLESGDATPVAQNDDEASGAPKIRPDEARIDWTRPAFEIRNQIRGLSPSPGAYTLFRGRRLKIWAAMLAPGIGIPGDIDLAEGEVTVMTGQEALRLIEVQPEGKRRMSPEEFARGARLQSGDRLGDPQDDRLGDPQDDRLGN